MKREQSNTMETTDSEQWIRVTIRDFEAKLLRYATRLTGDLETARDVVQDTFFRLCRAERAKVEEHISAWLYTVCRNRCFEIMRKEKRMTPLEDVHLETTGAKVADPSARIEHEDDRSELLKLIDSLPNRQQEVVRLKFQSGLSYKEISDVTELTVTNVGVILHNAVKRIRKEMRNNAGYAPLS